MVQLVGGNSQVVQPRYLDALGVGGVREITTNEAGTILRIHDGTTPGGFGLGTGESGDPDSGVASFNGRVGVITLTSADVLAAGAVTQSSLADSLANYVATTDFNTALATKAPVTSPSFIGTPTVPTATAGTQTTQAASTAFVMGAINTIVTGPGGVAGVGSFNGRVGVVVLTTADITGASGAPIASPSFTGTPLVPTAAPGTNTTQAANTAFVTAAIAAVNAATPGVTTFNTRGGAVVLNGSDLTAAGGALLASPNFTGSPTVPTATAGSNTTQAASTAFVATGLGLKANLASPTFTGAPLVPTASSGTNTTQAASTAFVTAAVAAISTQVTSFNGRTGTVTTQASDITSAGGALLASPNFSGTPTVPTAAAGDSTGTIASTAFVGNAVTAILASGVAGVATFNSRTGTVVLTSGDVTGVGGALLASPTFTGTPAVPTATSGTNTTQAASTAFVTAACAAVAAGAAGVVSFNTRTGPVVLTSGDVTAVGGALLASPTFTGTPGVPTAAAGTNTTQAASTAFVTAAIALAGAGGGGGVAGVSAFNGRAGAVTLTTADVTAVGGAVSASPTFTGTPSVPTATAGTNTTQAASTAFVAAATTGFAPLASPNFTGVPLVPTAAPGVNTTQAASTAYALAAAVAAAAGKANSASPTLTGVPAVPTAAAGTNTTQIASTAFATTAAAAAAASAASPKAPSASPTFTGVPLTPTAAALNNSTQVASTAYVDAAVSVLSATVLALIGALPPTTPKASADGTTIPSATQIIDSNLDVWTVVQDPTLAGVIKKNGVNAGTTSQVTLLLYFGTTIWQENVVGDWYKWVSNAWVGPVSTGDPRAPAGTPLNIPYFGFNSHYIQGGIYSSITLPVQAALLQTYNPSSTVSCRQDCYDLGGLQTMANTIVPQMAPVKVIPCFIPDVSGTVAATYSACFTLGAQAATLLAGKVPLFEIGNEFDIAALTAAGTINTTDGNLPSQYDQNTVALHFALMRGVYDGWKSIDTVTPLAVNCTYIHFAYLDMMNAGTLPNGAAATNGQVKFDVLTWHQYFTGGQPDSINGHSGTYSIFTEVEARTTKPYLFSETGGGDPATTNANCVSWINTALPKMLARSQCIGIIYYETYNFEGGSSPGFGLYSVSGTTATIKTPGTAYKALMAANPK